MHFKLECCFWQDIILCLVDIFLLSSSSENPALKCIELLTIFPTYLEHSDWEFSKNLYLLLQSQLKWSGIKLDEYQDISYCAFLYAMKLNEWVNLSVYITPYCSIVECPILHLHETQLFISWILINTLSNFKVYVFYNPFYRNIPFSTVLCQLNDMLCWKGKKIMEKKFCLFLKY